FEIGNDPKMARKAGVEYYNSDQFNEAALAYAAALEAGYDGVDNLAEFIKDLADAGRIDDETLAKVSPYMASESNNE
ncbi:MAG: hypothetical protein K5776_06290, partial [Lachnospiraceae bacterium]|nr:hypothetical protein [Lachnospiraceae bacterium]